MLKTLSGASDLSISLEGATIELTDADITYIRFLKGFTQLDASMDWYSRYALYWEPSTSLEADFGINVSRKVLMLGKSGNFNKDQGSHFTNNHFTKLLVD